MGKKFIGGTKKTIKTTRRQVNADEMKERFYGGRMIIFRPHRGTLSEALGEAMEFRDENEMFEWIEFQWGSFDGFLSKEDLSIGENSGDDERIGWKNVHYVCTKRFGETDYVKKYGYPQCIGYCSYDYKPMKG